MSNKIMRVFIFVATITGMILSTGTRTLAAQTAQPLTIGLSKSGLTSLVYNGISLLSSGNLSVQKAALTNPDGTSTDGSTTPTQVTFDEAKQKITQTYPWGMVSGTYAVVGSRLTLTVGVHNTSTTTLSGLQIQAMEISFPQAPQGWMSNYPYLGENTGSPTVNYANFGSGAVAVCNDDVTRPLLVGFPGRASVQVRPIWICTANIGYLSPMLAPYLKRPIAPGGFDIFHISLRFGPASAQPTDLAGDLYRKLAAAYPQTLHWPDHRPIGSLHLAVSETNYHSKTNPRGWFLDPAIDVVTPGGIAAFHKRILDYADGSITEMKKMNAQGMITWDLEGEQYPQSTTYIGDPRLLKTLDPEMESVADAYFKKFRAAGLRTGLCIRPQRLVLAGEKTAQQELSDPTAIAHLLYDKMAYANKRWGCTLFYVDSNGDPNVPYDPAIFQKLTQKLTANKINALIMPEHKNIRYYAYTAPYAELRLGVTSTPALVRAAYPNAFTNIYASDGPMKEDHDALVPAVRRGDILMFRAWWDDPQNAQVQSLYHDAGK